MSDATGGVGITELAYAKVNLTLEILGKRRDGYHNLASVMQTVDLFDTLTFSESSAKPGSSDIEVVCDDVKIARKANLVYKAAKALQERTGSSAGCRIVLRKRIPVSAGLGGGSADAAATLRGLNKLWNLELTTDELTEIAADIGSDVPFLVRGGTALVQGRGEEVTPITPAKLSRFLILSPEIHVLGSHAKTVSVFSHVTESMFTRGNLTHKLAARVRAGGDCPPEFFFNQFGILAETMFPGWGTHRDELMTMGAQDVTLCGAGPSMFTIPPSKELGTAWHLLLTTVQGKNAFLVDPAPAISESRGA